MWRKAISIYWNAPGGRPIMVALLMLLATTSDFLSMGALVPLVSQVTSDGGQKNSSIAKIIDQVFNFFAVPGPLGGHGRRRPRPPLRVVRQDGL